MKIVRTSEGQSSISESSPARLFARPCMLHALTLHALMLLLSSFAALAQTAPPPAEPWVAPTRAAARKNPVAANETSIALGKKTYERHCLTCHGPKGLGDGPTAPKLEKRPGNLANPRLWEQSDGALLWKLSEGHKPMPSFRNITSDEERWPVVNYIRTLAPKSAAPNQTKPDTKP